MLPALSTKPKQAMRQVKGLTNDSIDAYSNTPMGGGSMTSYADNTVATNESNGALSARAAPPSTGKPANGTGRSTARKGGHGDDDGHGSGGVLARVVRDRKASGDEELTLKAGDVVRVLSTKRTGYLKCEFGDDEGYVPSSYLEFFDESSGGAAGASGDLNDVGDENQRAEKRKKKKEKRHKDKKAAGGASDPEDAATTTPRSPRKANGDATGDEGDLSPRKRKKKSSKKHRHRDKGGDDDDADAPDTSKRGDETERRKGKKPKKKRHHESSESSESEDESARHRKSRRHRRGRRRGRGHSADSDSDSSGNSYNSSSDSGYTSRRRRRHRHHRKGSSSDDDEYDSDKRKSRHRSRRRGHSGSDDEGHDTARSARRSEKKRGGGGDVESSTPRGGKTDRERERDAANITAIEKGVAKLDVHNSGEKPSSRTSEVISDHTPEQDTGKKAAASGSASTGGSGTTATTSSKDRDESKSKSARSRKDDESRTESSVAAQKAKTNLGKQIGEKMRSLLGGGKKTERSHKSSSGILNACPGTTQGEEGWYEHGENERYYFVLLDGKWSLLYGPMTEEDFETYSSKVLHTATATAMILWYACTTDNATTRSPAAVVTCCRFWSRAAWSSSRRRTCTRQDTF